MHLAKFFELNAQPVPQRALGSQLFEQGLGTVERLRWRHFLAFKEVPEASLDFSFSKQSKPPQAIAARAACNPLI